MVEDSIVGLRAAKSAGMRCVITYTEQTEGEDFYGFGADAKLLDFSSGVQVRRTRPPRTHVSHGECRAFTDTGSMCGRQRPSSRTAPYFPSCSRTFVIQSERRDRPQAGAHGDTSPSVA